MQYFIELDTFNTSNSVPVIDNEILYLCKYILKMRSEHFVANPILWPQRGASYIKVLKTVDWCQRASLVSLTIMSNAQSERAKYLYSGAA